MRAPGRTCRSKRTYREARRPQPDNLVVGPAGGPGQDQLHLIDFGTAEPLRDRHGRRREDGQAAEGTLAFMAVSAHAKRPVSPRDDLEAFG